VNRENNKPGIGAWLFNPFRYVAGAQALFLGLLAIIAAAWLGSMTNTHFDGVMDAHTGSESTWWMFVYEGRSCPQGGWPSRRCRTCPVRPVPARFSFQCQDTPVVCRQAMSHRSCRRPTSRASPVRHTCRREAFRHRTLEMSRTFFINSTTSHAQMPGIHSRTRRNGYR